MRSRPRSAATTSRRRRSPTSGKSSMRRRTLSRARSRSSSRAPARSRSASSSSAPRRRRTRRPKPPRSPASARSSRPTFSELDGALKQARLLSVRVDQLSERVAQKRHALYASELFARNRERARSFLLGGRVPRPAGRVSWRTSAVGDLVERTPRQRALHSCRADPARHRRGRDRHAPVVVPAAVRRSLRHPRGEEAGRALWVFVWLALRTPVASFAGPDGAGLAWGC